MSQPIYLLQMLKHGRGWNTIYITADFQDAEYRADVLSERFGVNCRVIGDEYITIYPRAWY